MKKHTCSHYKVDTLDVHNAVIQAKKKKMERFQTCKAVSPSCSSMNSLSIIRPQIPHLSYKATRSVFPKLHCTEN